MGLLLSLLFVAASVSAEPGSTGGVITPGEVVPEEGGGGGSTAEEAEEAQAEACKLDEDLCGRARTMASRMELAVRMEEPGVVVPGRPATPENTGELKGDVAAMIFDVRASAAKQASFYNPVTGKVEVDLDRKEQLTAAYFGLMEPAKEQFEALSKTADDRATLPLIEDMLAVDGRLRSLEAEAKRAGPRASPEVRADFEARLRELSNDGGEVWRRLHALTLNASHDHSMGAEPYNDLQARVADMAARSQSVGARLGFSAAPAQARNDVIADMKGRVRDPFGSVERDGALLPSPGLLDVQRPKVLAAKSVPRGELFTGGSLGDNPMDAVPKETARVAAAKRQGRTLTSGDPSGRAAYVFGQEGGTCAIGSQAMILAELHGVPPDPARLKEIEDRLYLKATARGYYSGDSRSENRRNEGGTPNGHIGSLLGVPAHRKTGASVKELDAAARSGRMFIVGAEASLLWNSPTDEGGHALVVTGAELERSSGRVLGYYVNDTGANTGGRFVARSQFLRAWQKDGSYVLIPR